jgi:hypothetical protein
MAKYNKIILGECVRWVAEHGLIDYGGARLKDFLATFHIEDITYRRWMDKSEFKEAINEAKEVYKKNLTHDLVTSLSMTAKGYEREETETEYVPNPKDPSKPTIKKLKKSTKHYQPNVGAAIFLLTNLDPEHYQNRQRTAVALKKDDDKPMTIEEINKEIERLDKLDKEKDNEE